MKNTATAAQQDVMMRLVIDVPPRTYQLMQSAANIDRSRDLADWVLLAAWRHADEILASLPNGGGRP